MPKKAFFWYFLGKWCLAQNHFYLDWPNILTNKFFCTLSNIVCKKITGFWNFVKFKRNLQVYKIEHCKPLSVEIWKIYYHPKIRQINYRIFSKDVTFTRFLLKCDCKFPYFPHHIVEKPNLVSLKKISSQFNYLVIS